MGLRKASRSAQCAKQAVTQRITQPVVRGTGVANPVANSTARQFPQLGKSTKPGAVATAENLLKPTRRSTRARARVHQNYYKILQLTALHAGAGASRPGFCGLTGGSGSGAIGNSGSGAFRSTWRGRSLPSAPTVLSNWRIPPVDSNSFRCTPTVSW